MKQKKSKHTPQSPWEIKKQIVAQLRKSMDPVEQESLKQRLHHYTVVCARSNRRSKPE